MDFKDRLRKAMDFRSKRAVDICSNTPIDKSTLSYYLKGTKYPKQKTIEYIAKYLEVSPLYLMGYTNDYVVVDEKVNQHLIETEEDIERRSLITELNNVCSRLDNTKLKTIVEVAKAIK